DEGDDDDDDSSGDDVNNEDEEEASEEDKEEEKRLALVDFAAASLVVDPVTLPPRKRLCISPDPIYETGESLSAPTTRSTRGFRADYGFVSTLDAKIRRDPDREIGCRITDVWEDPDEIAEEIPVTDAVDQLNLLRRDRRFYARTARLIEGEARVAREAWMQAMDASDMTRYEKMPPRRAPRTRTTPVTATSTTLMTDAAIMALISQGVANALAKHEIQRNNKLNGDGSQGSRSGITRPVRPTRECTYTDFLKCQPMNFKGTEVVELALLCGRMFLEEFDKIKKYVGGLPDMIHGSVMTSKPKTMLDAVEFASKLMDKKICTFAERQTKNKTKSEDTSRNNKNLQQQNKR
nr:hypothetical protein [Tanacetum cinerariifolium]